MIAAVSFIVAVKRGDERLVLYISVMAMLLLAVLALMVAYS
jgi:hypothetical protein